MGETVPNLQRRKAARAFLIVSLGALLGCAVHALFHCVLFSEQARVNAQPEGVPAVELELSRYLTCEALSRDAARLRTARRDVVLQL